MLNYGIKYAYWIIFRNKVTDTVRKKKRIVMIRTLNIAKLSDINNSYSFGYQKNSYILGSNIRIYTMYTYFSKTGLRRVFVDLVGVDAKEMQLF